MKNQMMPAILLAAHAAARPHGVIGAVRNEVQASTEELFKTVKQQLEQLNGETKRTAENALKEAAKAGEVSAETKAQADRLIAQQTEMNNSVKALTEKLEGVTSQQLEIAQKLAEGSGRGDAGGPQTLGAAVVGAKAFKERVGQQVTVKVNNAITTAAGSGGALISVDEEREPVRLPRRALRIRDLLMPGSVSGDVKTYRKQTARSSGAGMVAETAASAASDLQWTKATAQVKKIATHFNVSEETMEDADALQLEIDGEGRYLIDLEEETQILLGDGTGENFSGLVTEATAFASPDAALPNANPIDRLRIAILQLALADYAATALVLNPVDWAKIDLLKVGAGDTRYVFGNPGVQSDPVLWGKSVVPSNTMAVNTWLAGDMAMAATYYDRRETEVIFSTEHGTNFIEDMVTVKFRKRAALAVKRPLALVTGNFTFS